VSEFIRDPELNKLVRELNERGERRATRNLDTADEESARRDEPDHGGNEQLDALLVEMRRRDASDLSLLSRVAPIFRIRGELVISEGEPLSDLTIGRMFQRYLTDRLRSQMQAHGYADFSVTTSDRASRFRVNLHRQRGELAAAVRILPAAVPTVASLLLPVIVQEFASRPNGLVLVCGPTGSIGAPLEKSSPSRIRSNTSIVTAGRSSNRSRSGATHRHS
jgi:hypothetical protein